MNTNRKCQIYLADLSYYNKNSSHRLFVPLSLGYIATYVTQLYSPYIEVSIFKNPFLLLDKIKEQKPDIVGFGEYHWNTNLNYAVVKNIRDLYGTGVAVVYGGPSIDTDPSEQQRMFARFPLVNALIPNEGELGFSNIVERRLLNHDIWHDEIDGVVYKSGRHIVSGKAVGLDLDLSTLKSPYTSGLLDPFLAGDYQPLLQTSRHCPYSCSFCVSGKNQGKIRGFNIEQVKEDVNYLAWTFKDNTLLNLYIVDENFGILERDAEIAAHIAKCSSEIGYPKKLLCYNDKKFTDTSKKVIDAIGHLFSGGISISLQTENPDSMKAIKRINLSPEEIISAIEWAKTRKLLVSSELIFGLPNETRTSFINTLNKCTSRSYDIIEIYHAILLDGSLMNRAEYRQEHGLASKFRILGSQYGVINGEFVAESDEVVVSSNHFSFEDFIEIRCLGFMFNAVYCLSFYKWFFMLLNEFGVNLIDFFNAFLNPSAAESWPQKYLKFVVDLKKATKDEMHDSHGLVEKAALQIYTSNNNDVGEPANLNMFYGSRLVYLEQEWLSEVLLKILGGFINLNEGFERKVLIETCLSICERERIDLIDIQSSMSQPSLFTEYDLIAWKNDKYLRPLSNYKINATIICLTTDQDTIDMTRIFNLKNNMLNQNDYYFHVFNFFYPRERLLFNMEYD